MSFSWSITWRKNKFSWNSCVDCTLHYTINTFLHNAIVLTGDSDYSSYSYKYSSKSSTSDYSPTRERTSSFSRSFSKPPLSIGSGTSSYTTTTRRTREVPRSYSYRREITSDYSPPPFTPVSPPTLSSPLRSPPSRMMSSPSYGSYESSYKTTRYRTPSPTTPTYVGAGVNVGEVPDSPSSSRRHMVRIRGFQTFSADDKPVDITDYDSSETGGYTVTTKSLGRSTSYDPTYSKRKVTFADDDVGDISSYRSRSSSGYRSSGGYSSGYTSSKYDPDSDLDISGYSYSSKVVYH